MSDESDELVSDYVDQMGLSVRVGSGSGTSDAYGVRGIPSSALIDPEGNLVWTGHPSALSSGTVKSALKGAKKRSTSFLAFSPAKEVSSKLASAVKAMEQGDLGKALASARALGENAKASDDEIADAEFLAGEIEAHLELLRTQAEGFVQARDVLLALSIFDALAKEMSGSDVGTSAKARALEIRKDGVLAKEIAGAEALAKAKQMAERLGDGKAKGKFEDVLDKYPDTRAAERAQAILDKD